MTSLTLGLIGVAGLLGIGLYGLLATRNLIKLIISLQILVKGALLGLMLAGRASGQPVLGQSLAVTVIVADTIVMVMALAMAVQIKRHTGSLDVHDLGKLRG